MRTVAAYAVTLLFVACCWALCVIVGILLWGQQDGGQAGLVMATLWSLGMYVLTATG